MSTPTIGEARPEWQDGGMDIREQDFTKKIAIVVRRDLPSWQVLNTVSHIAAYLGNKMREPFDTGEWFVTADGVQFPRNSQYPIIALATDEKELSPLVEKVRASGLLYLAYIRQMIETTDDAQLQAMLSQKNDSEVEYLGVGMFGDKEQIDALAKKFSLWK